MKRYAVVAGCLLLFFLAFWVGLKWNFPGQAMTRFVKNQTDQLKELDLKLSPATLGFTGINFDTLEIRSAGAVDAPPLLTLSDVWIPFSWRLPLGLSAAGNLGPEGRLSLFIPWWAGGTATLEGHIDFKEITMPAELAPLKVDGILDMVGQFEMKQPLAKLSELPDGGLTGAGKNIQVRGISYSGIEIPPTRLESVTVKIKSGKVVNLEQLAFNGDLQGSLKGVLTPNLNTPMLSSLRLEAQVTHTPAWLGTLGNLRPIAESFIKQGRLAFIMEGTVARLRFTEGDNP